jgi:hypothetical protein
MNAEIKLESRGLVISVEEKSSEIPGYASFLIIIKNQTQEARTLHGQMILTMDAQTKSEETGGCVVYAEIPAGSEVRMNVPCKTERYNMWQFQIVKIYNFILQSLLFRQDTSAFMQRFHHA